jgi:hypothetical protein
MEGQKIEPEGAVSSAYRGIEWTPFRAKLLDDFYNRSPIDMQCNQSDGSRFPGSWDAMDVPKFPPLDPPTDPNEECLVGLQREDEQRLPQQQIHRREKGSLEELLRKE